MNWMILPLKRYFDFRGRSQRKEYWLFVLFCFLVSIVLSIIDSALGLGGRATTTAMTAPTSFNYGARTSGGVLTTIFTLAILIPSISVGVRRLHDTDRTGWWLLLPIVPYVLMIGFVIARVGSFATGQAPTASFAVFGIFGLIVLICAIVILVFYCQDGTPGPNRFGPDPKGHDLTETFS